MTADQHVWCLTDEKINDLQVASIDHVIDRAKAAHFVDIRIRINGEFEIHQADWLKHLRRVTDPADIGQLMKFYNVSGLEDLVAMQSRHIERLQAKLPPEPAAYARSTPREG